MNQLKMIITFGYCSERYGFYLIYIRQGEPPWCASFSTGTGFVNDLTRKLGTFPSVFLHFGTTDHLKIFLEHAETLNELRAMDLILVSLFSSSWQITLEEHYKMKKRFPHLKLTLVGADGSGAGVNFDFYRNLARYIDDFESVEKSVDSQKQTR